MYKQLVALILFLAIIVWVYVTIKINRSFGSVETFSNLEPTSQDTDYLKKLNTELSDMSNFMTNEKFNNKNDNKKGIAPVIDTLKEFIMNKSNEYNRNNGNPEINGQTEKYTNTNKLQINKDNSKQPPTKGGFMLPTGDKVAKDSNRKPKCKFMPSYSESFTCPEKHSDHLGAVFGAKAGCGISCNGKKFSAETAKAYSVVRNGKVERIKLIAKGTHYFKPPKIKILGNGQGAKAKAILDKDSSIKYIKVISQGSSYKSSPKIVISSPDGYVYCHLCCDFASD